MRKMTIFLSVFLFLIISVHAFAQNDFSYEPSEIAIKVPDGYFDFPLEVYGAYISFDKEGATIKIDSFLCQFFKPNSRIVERQKTLDIDSLSRAYPNIQNKVHLNLTPPILRLFKKYGVYLIKRVGETFSPQDTIPHYWKRRDGKMILVKSPNMNKLLSIKFDKRFDPPEVAREFEKLKDIIYARPNYLVIPHMAPNDPDYQQGYQFYMQDYMKFENLWDIVRGQDAIPPYPFTPYYDITIAFIDGDFTNCDYLYDLAGNLNTNGPGIYTGQGTTGHGTEVASIACAVTDNFELIGGATWNCLFMPFVADNLNEVIAKLQTIRDYHNDPNPDNDCWVVNMSFGVPHDPDLEDICNELYNIYLVLLVAVVADNGSSQISYPAAYSSVIGVGASNISDNDLYSSSNWGDDVELVATGESVYSLAYYGGSTNNWGTSYAAHL